MVFTKDNEPLLEPHDITDTIIEEMCAKFWIKGAVSGRLKRYVDDFITMDIETSTIKRGTDDALAFTYSIAVYGADKCFLFRTWKDYLEFISRLTGALGLSYNMRLVCYVHNLPYEFQFMRDFMHISEVFATQKRKVVKCFSEGIEYRCSYKLTNMGLARFTASIPDIKHGKLSGADFDYSKLRTPSTYLSPVELAYIYNDVAGLYEALDYTITHDVYNVATIPLTSTGFVRNDLREAMQKNPENRKLFLLTALDQRLYGMLRAARRGGNTHCNPIYSDMELEDLLSEDMSSAYPAVIVQKMFPMSAFLPVPVDRRQHFEEYVYSGKWACLLDVTFYNIKVKSLSTIPYIPKAHCTQLVNITGDNGRVLNAECLSMVITDLDYRIIKETYDWVSITCRDCFVSKYDYLPMELRKSVIDMYYKKTTLKDGDPYYYMKIKNKFNAYFGCMLTDICQDEVVYHEHNCEPFTTEKSADYQTQLDRYYRSKNSFLSYQHGVWVTAWCRYRLQRAINGLKTDMVYCDTDSAKFFDTPVNRQLFVRLNEEIREDIERCGIDCTVEYKGKHYTLGLWDDDGYYPKFKSMGAKKYCYYDKDGVFNITVAGLSKSKAKDYLLSIGGMDAFTAGTIVPKAYSGRTTAKYNDWEGVRTLTLSTGEKIWVGSNMVIEDTTYQFTLAEDYEMLLENIKEGVIY